MHFLHALGINQYAIVQFVIFACLFTFLSGAVFRPFFAALLEREKRTVSSENVAEEYLHKTAELNTEYQNKARSVRAQIQEIFQKKKDDAAREYDVIVGKARDEANSLIEKNRQQITQAVTAAGQDLRGQTSTVALAITNKLLGK